MSRSKGKIVGIDIGNYRVKISVVVNGQVTQFLSESVPDNTVKDGVVTNFQIMGDLIKSILKENKITIKEAALSLPNSAVYTKTSAKLPLMTTDQLRINLPYEFHDYIPDNIGNYIYDYRVTSITDDEMDLFAVAASKDLMLKYQEMFTYAGLKLRTIIPEYIGFENVISAYEDASSIEHGSRDYALLDVGETTIRMHFFTKGRYEITRELEFGCRMMINAYADQINKDPHIAHLNIEACKFEEGDAYESFKETCGMVSVQLMRVINFYNFNNRDNTMDTIYCCGGGAKLKDMISDITETTGMPVKPFTDLISEVPVEVREDIVMSPQSYGIVIGGDGVG